MDKADSLLGGLNAMKDVVSDFPFNFVLFLLPVILMISGGLFVSPLGGP